MFTQRPHSQSAFEIRLDWGIGGLADIGIDVGSVVVVDVLSFTTVVDVACARGAYIYPSRWKDDRAAREATALRASLAVNRNDVTDDMPYSLSPGSVRTVPATTKIVLPSPNGAEVSIAAAELRVPVFAACLRNRQAVAAAVDQMRPVAVIAAGERRADGSMRAAWEDIIGAGAIIELLGGTSSPEAQIAAHGWSSVASNPLEGMADCASGRELIGRGYRDDVEMAAETDVSSCVPMLVIEKFIHYEHSGTAIHR